jgi:hypothetical protein
MQYINHLHTNQRRHDTCSIFRQFPTYLEVKKYAQKKCADADTAPLNQNILPHQCATKKMSHP